MVLLCLLQLLLSLLHVVLTVRHVSLYAVYLLPLRINQVRQLIEQLYTLVHRSLQFLYIPVFILNVADPVGEADAGLTVDFFLKEFLG